MYMYTYVRNSWSTSGRSKQLYRHFDLIVYKNEPQANNKPGVSISYCPTRVPFDVVWYISI